MRKIIIESDSYFDSVFLMHITGAVKKIPGVIDGAVFMGTEMNVDLLRKIGFSGPEAERATPHDLIIAVEARDEEAADRALKSARDLLRKKRDQVEQREERRPASLDTALTLLPDANLVLISLPGAFAAEEARKALEKGLHVLLFSDHVSLEEEIELKRMASGQGLLMMGPDCGTAILGGKPLCFANVVRRGDIGIVGASGTGIQEVCANLDRLGGGVSHAIGTGGRDLQKEIGGITTLMAVEALKEDPDTAVLVVISKPPAEEVAEKVIARLQEAGKPGVIYFAGLEPSSQGKNLRFAGNLEEAAAMALSLSRGEEYRFHPFSLPDGEVQRLVEQETSRMERGQIYLRGLFTGGTLADEAMFCFAGEGMEVYSNNQTQPHLLLKDPRRSLKHTVIDLGDDVFTAGRPHPMIDPSSRQERILQEMQDPQMAVLLLDVVLGYGSHGDPAGALCGSLLRAKGEAEKRGGYLSVVASVTGTEGDFQNLYGQRKKLEGVGCVVMPSNAQASRLAARIIGRRAGDGG